jgi:hypothetical protein
MNPDSLVADAEHELRLLASALTEPRPRECLLCYVYRMLEHGCTGHRWTARYRDLRAPRATGLERRLGQKGGYCDCEIFMNAYEPVRQLWIAHPAITSADPDDAESASDEDESDEDELVPPDVLPPCHGVRAGSTQGCAHWVRQWRGGW